MLEPEQYIHIIALSSNNFYNRHVKLMKVREVEGIPRSQIARQATRTLGAINAIRMMLDEYERDMIDPFLVPDKEAVEQLV